MLTTLTSTDIAAGIQTWIRCESPSNSPQGIAAMVATVEQHARAAGLPAVTSPAQRSNAAPHRRATHWSASLRAPMPANA